MDEDTIYNNTSFGVVSWMEIIIVVSIIAITIIGISIGKHNAEENKNKIEQKYE